MKTFFSAIAVCCALGTHAQFTVRDATSSGTDKHTYDSSVNFNQLDCSVDPQTIIGQELYFVPANSKYAFRRSEDSTYRIFSSNVKTPLNKLLPEAAKKALLVPFNSITLDDPLSEKEVESYRLIMNITSHVYKPLVRYPIGTTRGNEIGVSTPPSALEGKFFKIVNYTALNPRKHGEGQVCTHQIVMVDENKEQITWKMHSSEVNAYPIVYIRGYVEKLKNAYLNQSLYLKTGHSSFMNPLDGQIHGYDADKKLTCVDVTFIALDNDRYTRLALIMKQEDNKEIAVYPTGDVEVTNGLTIDDLMSEQEYLAIKQEKKKAEEAALAAKKEQEANDKKMDQKHQQAMIAKYGAVNGKLIANNDVKLGFTKEMCQWAWGTPNRTSKAAVGGGTAEVWLYSDGRMLHFQNNKLTQITN